MPRARASAIACVTNKRAPPIGWESQVALVFGGDFGKAVGMEQENLDPITVLPEEECWALLDGAQPGRIAFSAGGIIDIVPVNYVRDGHSILFRTAQGNKLLGLTANPHVAFETDARTGGDAWSVVIRGEARVIEGQGDIARAESLGLEPWVPTLKYTFVRITPSEISGRRFTVGPEPERY